MFRMIDYMYLFIVWGGEEFNFFKYLMNRNEKRGAPKKTKIIMLLNIY